MEQATVTKPYADYSWYSTKYGGTVIPVLAFPRHARWATSLIDAVTYGNIDSDDKVLDAVRDACCAAAEMAYNYYRSSVDVEGGRGMKSENNDGYSVTFDDSVSTESALRAECIATIRAYLHNTGLLHRMVRRHHCDYGY